MRKKLAAVILSMVCVMTMIGCGNQDAENTPVIESETTVQEEQSTEEVTETVSATEEASEMEVTEQENSTEEGGTEADSENSDTLVVYFSMPETADPDNMTEEEDNSVVVIDGQVLGNTQYVAMLIQEYTGGDIFRIEPEVPYTTEHEALIDYAKEEQNNNARPAMKESVPDLSEYETIYIGYPNWWGDMPMILYTFFDSIDLSGKTIIPFNTHGGSGFSNTISTIAGLEPEADVNEDGYTVSRNDVENSRDEVFAWLDSITE